MLGERAVTHEQQAQIIAAILHSIEKCGSGAAVVLIDQLPNRLMLKVNVSVAVGALQALNVSLSGRGVEPRRFT